ncbi:MAG: carbohydrate-binding domain-containing protein [Eubacterium sp.]|nr:carbohydrate-binding domain-containing protein [Eubacterium sp.]
MSYKKHLRNLMIVATFLLTGCSVNMAEATGGNEYFTDRDRNAVVDENKSAVVNFIGDKADIDYRGLDESTAKVSTGDSGKVSLMINKEGTFILKGNSPYAEIVVDTDNASKVELVLDSVELTNIDGAVLFVKKADKTFINCAADSVNKFSDTGEKYTDETGANAVIYSRDDVVFHGSGKLDVNGGYKYGIVSENDIKILGIELSVQAKKTAITANDSLRISDGKLTLVSGTDGLHVDEGFFYEENSNISVTCEDDAIHATTDLTIGGGELNITRCREGLEGHNVLINGGDIMINAIDDTMNAYGEGDEPPCLTVKDGNLTLLSEGDCLDSNGAVIIDGGNLILSSKAEDDDGTIDALGGLYINGGTLIATGRSKVSEVVNDGSRQNYIYATSDKVIPAGHSLRITDDSSNELLAVSPSEDYSSVFFTTSGMKKGSYHVIMGDDDVVTELK